ncbi:hypothetical protein V6N13_054197 [Hibiscus sabdariffa]
MAPPTLSRILQLILSSCLLAAGASLGSQPCEDKCGDVSIPYPFGTTPECYLNRAFLITCNKSSSTHRPQLGRGNLVVTNITLEGQVEVLNNVARDCYSASGTRVDRYSPWLRASMYTISNDRNKFTAVGCDTYATVTAEREDSDTEYITGCISYCDKNDAKSFGNSCSGIGCCQIPIPSGLKNINVSVTSYNNHTYVWDFNPCSYAFVADQSKFNFSFTSFDELEDVEFLPMVLDWAIGNETCNVSQGKFGYACKQNSICLDPANRSGYICKCKVGYEGNPYHPSGCQDIDECQTSKHDCVYERKCVNTPGSYKCSCPKGFHGDGRKDGTRCSRNELNVIKISIAFSLCVLVVIVGSSWLFYINKKRKVLNMKKKFFRQNGGLLLQQELHEREASTETVKIFTSEELETATKNYDESHIIGRGGFGTVYKGPEEERNLANHFNRSLRNDRLFQILDEKVANERAVEQIKEVAKLAKRCLSIKGEERPSMKEVAQELEDLRKLTCQHPWAEVAVNIEETQFLLGQASSVSTYVSN